MKELDRSQPVSITIMADASVDGKKAGLAGTVKITQNGDQVVEPLLYEGAVQLIQNNTSLSEAIALELGVDTAMAWLADNDMNMVKQVHLYSDSQSTIDGFGRERKTATDYAINELGRELEKALEGISPAVSKTGFVLKKIKAHVPTTKATKLEKEHNEIDKRAKAALDKFKAGELAPFDSRAQQTHGKRLAVVLPDDFDYTDKTTQYYYDAGREYAEKGIALRVIGMGVNSVSHPMLEGYNEVAAERAEPIEGFSYTLMPSPARIPSKTVAWFNHQLKSGPKVSVKDSEAAAILTAVRGTTSTPGTMKHQDEVPAVLVLPHDPNFTAAEGLINRIGNVLKVNIDNDPQDALRTMSMAPRLPSKKVTAKERITLLANYVEGLGISDKNYRMAYFLDVLNKEGLRVPSKMKNEALKRVSEGSMKSGVNLILKEARTGRWNGNIKPESVFLAVKEAGQVGGDSEFELVPESEVKYEKGGKNAELKQVVARVVEAIPESGISPTERLAMLQNGLAMIGLPEGVDVTNLAIGKGSVKHKTMVDKVANFWVNKKLPRPHIAKEAAGRLTMSR